MTHPRHEDARRAMAQRLADFLYANDQGSDWVAESIPIEFYWVKYVCRGAGESHIPSQETRELAVEILRDLEASGKPKNLALRLDSGEVGTSSWGANLPDTTSDGATPTPSLPAPEPPVPSETLATSPAFRGEGRAAPEGPDSPHQASTDKRPAVPVRHTSRSKSVASPDPSAPVSPRGRGGQASLPFQPHSETSRLAAQDEETKDVAAAHRLLVLQTLREHGPLTDDQIADHLGLTTEQVRIRRVGLMHDRYVEQVGRGLSRKGRPCNTWGLTQDAAVSA